MSYRRKPTSTYEPVRNALVKLVVDCARESNGRHRSGPQAKGWAGASRRLGGIAMTTLQSVAWGCARASTAEKVRAALVAAGLMKGST